METLLVANIASVALIEQMIWLVYKLCTRDSRMKHLPPGPKGLPIIGNMLEMAATDRMMTLSKQWADEYGDVFYTKVGFQHFIWLSSAAAVKDLMDKRGSIYSSRAASPMINMVSNQERVNFLPNGDKWRTIGNILHSALNLETSSTYKPVQDFESKRAVWEILQAKGDTEISDINRRCSTNILKIVRHFSLATAPGGRIIDTLPMLTDIVPQFLLQNWKTVARQWYEQDSQTYLRMYNKLLRDIEAGTTPDCFLEDLAREKLQKNPFSDVTAAFATGALIEAGRDATTTALNNVILACLLYPEVVAGAHEELDRVVGSDRIPDFSDEPRLPYIRGIAKETRGWRPSNKIGTCHSTTQDDWHKGYFIPKGAVAVLHWWAIHMDEGRWKDPHRFDPSRYLQDPLTEAESMAQADAKLRDHFTFGAGRRNCPGVHIAHNSLFTNIARLFWAFNIQKSVDENGDAIEPSTAAQPGLLLTPARFPCKFEARSEKHAALIEQTWSDAQKQGLVWWKEKQSKNLLGPLNAERLTTLQANESLPDKNEKVWELISQTVNMADRIVKLLQPPAIQLAETYLGMLKGEAARRYFHEITLSAVVTHDIPDVLSSGPLSTDTLAQRSGLQPLRLKQVMRVLRNNGIFEYEPDSDTYSNNDASALLQKDHWTQWHRWVSLYGDEFYDAAKGIPEAIKAEEARSAAQITYGTDKNIFTYFAEQGLQEKFHKALGAGATAQAPGMLADYNWKELGDAVVCDIGGGGGDFITALLRDNPRMRGALLEMGPVIEMVKPKYDIAKGAFADVADRMVELHSGDFLTKIPSYEVYTMKWCLHNWTDSDVVKVLRNVRRAIKISPLSRMVVIESVLAEGRSSRVERFGDLTMMSTTNGLERTEAEWVRLARQAGWVVKAITPLRHAWAAAIDLRPFYAISM
ncbi:cytochrome p450 [Trichoderma arundinaceum]|uniref:Cytochrome p450 n=1 Tax=Trichoderma arundinaceum TaxID=490622 RepID=A0A395NQ01_TRIAR|nr:cytochrome p450 [Trichoderma arundinaceum]